MNISSTRLLNLKENNILSRISKPYYNLHQITTGQFTDGNEFALNDGTIYVGSYHILPNNQRFTEFQPNGKSVELFELRLNPTQDILRYNQITGNAINKYIAPISFQPNPSLDDYKKGRIERFFIQKRNSSLNTIIEIDSNQFNSINTLNNPGINGVIWNKLKINWIISKIPKEDAFYLNQQQLIRNSINFPGIGIFITNPLEFYR